MQISNDYFLVRLGVIIIPAFILLIATILISFLIIRKYSRAVKRLYQMNFNGVEFERKRIANDMHDQIGYTIIQLRNSLFEASNKTVDVNVLNQINIAQRQISDLHLSLRYLIENIYPRELMDSNWKASFEHLANGLSIGGKNVQLDVDDDVDFELSNSQLHNMFRLTQEMLANIFMHGNTNRVNLQIYIEGNTLCLNFTYRPMGFSIPLARKLSGRGSFIIAERLRLLNANIQKLKVDGYCHEIISFPISK